MQVLEARGRRPGRAPADDQGALAHPRRGADPPRGGHPAAAGRDPDARADVPGHRPHRRRGRRARAPDVMAARRAGARPRRRRLLATLAAMLRTIHAHDPGTDRPRTYQSWAPAGEARGPRLGGDPALWRAAFAILDRPAPAYDGTFLHRDFHLGNVLWTGPRITGVVDWVETSWGPAGLDVAHCATYLALLHGPEAATRFVAAYGAVDARPSATGTSWTAWATCPTRPRWRRRGVRPAGTSATRSPGVAWRSTSAGCWPASRTAGAAAGRARGRPRRRGC